MKIQIKALNENLKAISGVVADFVYIDCTDLSNYALYISTDVQAVKVPLEITDVANDEQKIYVISKIEFCHLVPYVTEFLVLNGDYSYNANNGAIKGKFESNSAYEGELESRKSIFDNEDSYTDFAEITPTVFQNIMSGSIFVAPDSVKPSEKFLDIKDGKVFSYSKMRIYINDIAVENEGLLSNEVIKSIQSLGIGTIIKKNDESLLLTNPQRSIFEYFSTPNNVEFHPVLEDKFKGKIEQVKTFNKITINIEELRSKLDYISFYSSRNPNSLTNLIVEDGKVHLSSDENTKVELPIVEMNKTEEFETMSVPFDCSSMQLICSKIGKGECENLSWFVSSESDKKLMLVQFGDSEETVIIAKLNL